MKCIEARFHTGQFFHNLQVKLEMAVISEVLCHKGKHNILSLTIEADI